MPLCVAAMNIRYPGDQVSKSPCANTPGMPNLVISETLFQPIICHSSVRIGSSQALYGPSQIVQYLRLPAYVRVEYVARQIQREANGVTIVVVPDIMAPVNQWRIILVRMGQVPVVN